MKITINNKEIEIKQQGKTILEIARENKIKIPTLCYHPSLKPYGSCRLCIVEIIKGPKPGLVTSCTYPVETDGLVIETDSENVIKSRKFILELLLAQCPEAEIIQEMAKEYKITHTRFKIKKTENDKLKNCILCGLCVRVCNEVIQQNVLSFVNRGAKRTIATPFDKPYEYCLTCGACAYLCPTDVINTQDILGIRKLTPFMNEQKLKKCKMCGKDFIPEILSDKIKNKLNIEIESFQLCQECRKKQSVQKYICSTKIL